MVTPNPWRMRSACSSRLLGMYPRVPQYCSYASTNSVSGTDDALARLAAAASPVLLPAVPGAGLRRQHLHLHLLRRNLDAGLMVLRRTRFIQPAN